MTPWNQVTIIGTGLIGGSLGLALKEAGAAGRVVGVGHRQGTLDLAVRRGAVDAGTLDPAEGVAGSDLVVLATAVGLFERVVRDVAGALAAGAVVIDVGSTKARVVRTLDPLMAEGRTFVGCHPIAGSEKRGIAHANAGLFRGATCVVTPTDATPAEAVERVTATWEAVGMTVLAMTPQDHDRLLAESSHLPHVAAAALVRTLGEGAEPLVGTGWTGTTRIASGDPVVWRDILTTNADAVAQAVARYQEGLEAFRRALAAGDAGTVERLLAEAQRRRDNVTGA